MMTSPQIMRAAAYYARATAIRAVHGVVLPEPDPEADALFWKETEPNIQAEILKIVGAIFAAANPQPKTEPHEGGGFDRTTNQGL
jgi:hypothetical protein